jgi:hypothetical protein
MCNPTYIYDTSGAANVCKTDDTCAARMWNNDGICADCSANCASCTDMSMCIECDTDYEFNWGTYTCDSTVVVCMDHCDNCTTTATCNNCT